MIWKADIDSAFRRIPIAAEQRQFAWIAFSTYGGTYLAEHKSMPFGSVASVHCWDRIGNRNPLCLNHKFTAAFMFSIAARLSLNSFGKKGSAYSDYEICGRLFLCREKIVSKKVNGLFRTACRCAFWSCCCLVD